MNTTKKMKFEIISSVKIVTSCRKDLSERNGRLLKYIAHRMTLRGSAVLNVTSLALMQVGLCEQLKGVELC